MGLLDAIRKVQGTVVNQALLEMPTLPLAGQRILLVYLFPGLGDHVVLLPVLKALLDGGAKAPIGLVMYPRFADIIKSAGLDVEMIFATDMYGAGAETAAELPGRWDVAADLTLRAKVDSESWLKESRAPVTLGFQGASMPLTWAAPNHRYAQYQHWSQYVADPLKPFGIQPAYDVAFRWSDADEVAAGDKWVCRPRVLIIPGGSRTDNCWPPELFSRVGQHVHDRLEASVVLVGAPGEKEILQAMQPQIGTRVRLFYGKSMTRLLALIASADVVVSNDTGPMHFAYFLSKPTVAAFKTMSPLCWGPPKPDPRFVVFDYTLVEDVAAAVERCVPQMVEAVTRLVGKTSEA